MGELLWSKNILFYYLEILSFGGMKIIVENKTLDS